MNPIKLTSQVELYNLIQTEIEPISPLDPNFLISTFSGTSITASTEESSIENETSGHDFFKAVYLDSPDFNHDLGLGTASGSGFEFKGKTKPLKIRRRKSGVGRIASISG